MKLSKKQMNPSDSMATTKEALLSKIAELTQNLKSREDIALTQTSDILDAIQLAENRELAIENIQRNSRVLNYVRKALARLEEGSYGICQECDLPLAEKRLEAIPWAVRCVRCEEKADEEYQNQTPFYWQDAA